MNLAVLQKSRDVKVAEIFRQSMRFYGYSNFRNVCIKIFHELGNFLKATTSGETDISWLFY